MVSELGYLIDKQWHIYILESKTTKVRFPFVDVNNAFKVSYLIIIVCFIQNIAKIKLSET